MPLRNVVGRVSRNPWVARSALLVLAVALAFEIVALRDEEGLPEAPAETVEVVRDFATAVGNYDYRRIDADIDRLLAFGTPTFARDFKADLGADYVKAVRDHKRVSVGEIDAGPTLDRLTADKATFLVVVNQTITSDGKRIPRRVGIQVTVDRKSEKVETARVL